MEDKKNDAEEQSWLDEEVRRSVINGLYAYQNEQTHEFITIDRKSIWGYNNILEG